VNIEAAGQVEEQGAQEGEEKHISQDNAARQPAAHNEQAPEGKLEPRQDQGGDIDEAVRKDLVIVDHLGKRRRIEDLVDTGGKEDRTDEQAHPEEQRQSREQVPMALRVVAVPMTG